MKNIDIGDKIKVETETSTLEGTVTPSNKENTIFLKLESGYNTGIKKDNIKEITIKNKSEEKTKEKTKEKIKQDEDLPLISILHTGGTIASKVDYKTGAVTAKFNSEELLELFPELRDKCRIRSVQISNMLSESMRFSHYNKIAEAIKKELEKEEKPEGIIITHGTDTMHYSSSALSFILEGINKPVLLVGAQRSSDRGSTDASLNLNSAVQFCTESDFKGIGICMHSNTNDKKAKILPACKSRKMHTSRRDAFQAINSEPIAEVNPEEEKINFIRKDYHQPQEKELSLKKFEEIKTGILKTYTNMTPEDFKKFEDYEGLVIEGTGLGHTQVKSFDEESEINEENKKALENISENTIITITSQCINGRINLNVYSPGRRLKNMGVIPGEDMTTETAFIKISWLLSNYEDEEKIKELMKENLRGEISERTPIN